MSETLHPDGGPGSDALVRDVLETLAAQVTVSPDAYHAVRAEWVRRQRRRRRLGVLVATILIILADLAGLWALNRADTGDPVIFDQRTPTVPSGPSGPSEAPVPRLGQP